jgi:hypothetical protein
MFRGSGNNVNPVTWGIHRQEIRGFIGVFPPNFLAAYKTGPGTLALTHLGLS